jgi:hypothetical protein
MNSSRDQIRFRYIDGSVEVFSAGLLESRVGSAVAAAIALALVGYGAGYEQDVPTPGAKVGAKDGRVVVRVGLVVPDMQAPFKAGRRS